MIKGHSFEQLLFYFRPKCACFEINCTNVLSLASEGAAILEINKPMMKTYNIRKLVWTNYVTNVYKNGIVWGWSHINFFVCVCKKKKINRRRSRLGNRKRDLFF